MAISTEKSQAKIYKDFNPKPGKIVRSCRDRFLIMKREGQKLLIL